MSNPQQNIAKSKLQAAIAILGGLVAPFVVVYLLVHTNTAPVAEPVHADTAKVEERIKPVANVEVGEAGEVATAGATKSGEEIVKSSCAACHASGAMGAPKIGDKAAWGPRIAEGYETLVHHAITGLRMMPPKGGNPALSDEEIGKAVAFMADEAGAKFVPPSP
jgi:cytochrome c5